MIIQRPSIESPTHDYPGLTGSYFEPEVRIWEVSTAALIYPNLTTLNDCSGHSRRPPKSYRRPPGCSSLFFK
jgi:hypothetical protein